MNYVAVLCYTKETFDQWYKEMEIKEREKRRDCKSLATDFDYLRRHNLIFEKKF
jgi:hypothetical protein